MHVSMADQRPTANRPPFALALHLANIEAIGTRRAGGRSVPPVARVCGRNPRSKGRRTCLLSRGGPVHHDDSRPLRPFARLNAPALSGVIEGSNI